MEEEQHSGRPPTALVWMLRTAVACLAVVIALSGTIGQTYASSSEQRMLVPVGRAVGIKLFSEGVLIVGLSELSTEKGACNPAVESGLQQGDIITHINSTQVETIEEVQAMLQTIEGEPMSIRATRGETQIQVTATAVQCSSDGVYKLGAWMRDSMAGIGTMTYYDPETKEFGALGHGINDIDTSLLMPLESGSILPATVAEVLKGNSGSPGQLIGAFQMNQDLGTLSANTDCGIFGTLDQEDMVADLTPIPLANPEEVSLGAATILSNVQGDQVVEYTVEIIKLYSATDEDSRDMMVRVTDSTLLETTGGIVQGMSGSPIIQNGKLIGAVTHVLVNDPTRGYGIFMDGMLETATLATESLS